jgi:hypothetical protein
MATVSEQIAMTPQQARDHLARLGLTQGEFTRLMGVNDRTGRRWLSDTDGAPMPRAVAIALELLTPKTVKKWMPEPNDGLTIFGRSLKKYLESIGPGCSFKEEPGTTPREKVITITTPGIMLSDEQRSHIRDLANRNAAPSFRHWFTFET